MVEPWFRVQTTQAPTIQLGGISITPRAQAFALRLPFGGWVWNRPLDVVVERPGRVEHLPIVDVTLLAQIALGCLAIIVAIAAGSAGRSKLR